MKPKLSIPMTKILTHLLLSWNRSCKVSLDCKCGEVCSNGACLQKCLSPRDCNNGLNCVGGVCTAGCLRDQDCIASEACISGSCRDPCKATDCGQNALCQTTNHNPVCLCPRGYQRHPTDGCVKAECSSNKDCSSDRSCKDGLCVNPCSLPNACGRNAQCSVRDHKPQCACPSGYIGNPSVRCPHDKDDCIGNPCGRNALCTDLVGTFECRYLVHVSILLPHIQFPNREVG